MKSVRTHSSTAYCAIPLLPINTIVTTGKSLPSSEACVYVYTWFDETVCLT